jgi:hypothetical protein
VQWLTAGGGYVHPHLDLMADLGDGERGVVVTQAIQDGEQLAVVPMRLCLHTPTLAQQARWYCCRVLTLPEAQLCAPLVSELFV